MNVTGQARYGRKRKRIQRRNLERARNVRPPAAKRPGVLRLTSDHATGYTPPGKGKKTLSIGITTAGRGDEATILHMLTSLKTSGFEMPPHIFAEPNSVAQEDMLRVSPHATIHARQVRLGCFRNWKHMVNSMLSETKSDWILLLQDDVIWSRYARGILQHAIDTIDASTVGFLSPYVSPAMIPDRAKRLRDTWVRAKNRNFWGALALCFPRESLVYLSRSPVFQNHKGTRQVDVIAGRVYYEGQTRRWPVIHLPSLADHIGEHSTIGRGADKQPASQWARHGWKYVESYGDQFVPQGQKQ